MVCGKAFAYSEELELHGRRGITRIRKSACSYGRPAKKKRPAKGLEDPIGSRTRHDFIIV